MNITLKRFIMVKEEQPTPTVENPDDPNGPGLPHPPTVPISPGKP